ncbi:MAG: glycosyltransferase family 4 protein [Bradymonadaceae bacterium]|nr:glycosyltransferase family 4 protein [Lujinxingiaceae bacterium]
MRILCLTSSYPRYASDIAGRFVLEFCDHLARCGHVVDVLTWSDAAVDDDFAPINHCIERVRYAPSGLDTLFYGAGVPENLEQTPLKGVLVPAAMATMAARLVQKVRARRNPYDVIVGHWLLPGGILARLCGKLLAIRSVVVGHSGGVHLLGQMPKPIARQLARIVVDGALTVPTAELRDKLCTFADARHASVLPMGFEPPPVDQSAIKSERVDWLCMGRHVPIKGFDVAIDAFSRARLHDGSNLHIAGDGPDRVLLEAQARARPDIHFHGIVTGSQKSALLARCGYYLLPSKTLPSGRHEGLPVSFLEAASLGLIALSGPVPGIDVYLARPELQRVAEGDVAAWSRAIERLSQLASKERAQLAQASREKVAHLAWPRLIKDWERVLFG